MDVGYIIVQAGGKGTRLEHLTANKPKALLPVENLPLLFHLFRKFPDKRYIIIADYKKDVLREYLDCFADVKHIVVDTEETGSCAGIDSAVKLLPDGEPFMLIWSDIILPDSFLFPARENNHIGISQTFPCRWSYKDGEIKEEPSEKHGVAGLFIFKDKSPLVDVSKNGEFVRWLKEQKIEFSKLGLANAREFGLLSKYEELKQEKCRPFNKLIFNGDVLTKKPVDVQGENLAVLERKWYKTAVEKGIKNIPKIFSHQPLTMELINGKNVYEYQDLATDEKLKILVKLIDSLKQLHLLGSAFADSFSLREAYYVKTMERLCKVRDLLPFSDKKTITVNGRECRNVFFYKRDLEKKLALLKCDKFSFIHGDCTFSNIMLKNDTEPVFIDPRGYFGHTELYGDPNYDFAKLYYSLLGNYDRFNLKDFRLTVGEKDITLKINSNRWEALESDFFKLSGTNPDAIRLIHAVIWLSLTTYARQDYDSILGAFYNGLYYLEELL